MRIGTFEFNANWKTSLITLVLLVILVRLGIWQYGRSEEKRQVLHQQSEQAKLPVLPITAADLPREQLEYRRLTVIGQYLPEFMILVDNKVHKGEVGYNVVMPLQIQDTKQLVLVNRGWIKGDIRRLQLPQVKTEPGVVHLSGLAKYDTKDVVSFFSANRLGTSWPAQVRWIDVLELQNDLPMPLKPYVFLQDPEPADGLAREWVFVNSPPEKNMSYSVQWFSLAAALLLIYIIVNTKRIARQEEP